MPTPHPALDALDRITADLALVRTLVGQLIELRAACADLHAWAEENSLGDVPQLAALVGRLRAVLGGMER
jgi:hypothetical protein